jgi:hypothetical protein
MIGQEERYQKEELDVAMMAPSDSLGAPAGAPGHSPVETTGSLLAAKFRGACLHDRDGGRHALGAAGATGPFGQWVDRQARRYGLGDGLPRGFRVIPRR